MLFLALAAVLGPEANGLTYVAAATGQTRRDSRPGIEYQLTPSALLQGAARRVWASAGYSPRLILAGPGQAVGGVLHRGSLSLQWQPTRTSQLSGSEQLSYGRTDFSWLAAAAEGATPALDRLQQSRPLAYQQSESTVGLEQGISRALRLAFKGTYTVSGGADQEALAVLPLLRVVGAAASGSWRIDRKVSLGIAVRTSFARISSLAQRARTWEVDLRWQRRFARRLQFIADVGLGYAASMGSSPQAIESVQPTFAATLIQGQAASERGLVYSLGARLAPIVDPIDGSVSFRPEASISMQAPLAHRFFLRAIGTASRISNSTLHRETIGIVAATLGYRPAPGVVLTTGVWSARRHDIQWGGFIGATMVRAGRF